MFNTQSAGDEMNLDGNSKIHLLNAHGPYEHGIWGEEGASHESLKSKAGTLLFFNRSFDLVERISLELLKIFSTEELHQMTILDVGCYDAWILNQLNKKFRFKRAVGIEPREKNIQKGRYAREHYAIQTNIEIFQGTIDSANTVLSEEKFDIVLCLGTLHHVESTPSAVEKLSNLSRDVLFIDSMVIDQPKKESKNILRLLNLKDIAYLGSKNDWAVAAYKFETPYFDGSSADTSIVNVPEERLIRMALEISSFGVISSSSPEKSFYNKTFQKLRGVKESFLLARRITVPTPGDRSWWSEKAVMHEENNVFEILNQQVLEMWLKKLGLLEESAMLARFNRPLTFSEQIKSRLMFFYSENPVGFVQRMVYLKLNIDKPQGEILTNISRSPVDKCRLEVSKTLIEQSDFVNAISELAKILNREGADWRSFYRATYLSMLAAFKENDIEGQNYFENLLQIANPAWPISMHAGLDRIFKNESR